MKITPSDSRQNVKTPKDYQVWLDSLQDGDIVMLQEFHQKTESNDHEYWKYSKCIFRGDKIILNGNSKYIKNGVSLYTNSKTLVGEVFVSRIVPYCSDLRADEGHYTTMANSPIYEPNFLEKDRSFAYVPIVPNNKHREIAARLVALSCGYAYKVHQGLVVIIFGIAEDLKPEIEKLATYLYSEDC
jgi:hypothetical protein